MSRAVTYHMTTDVHYAACLDNDALAEKYVREILDPAIGAAKASGRKLKVDPEAWFLSNVLSST